MEHVPELGMGLEAGRLACDRHLGGQRAAAIGGAVFPFVVAVAIHNLTGVFLELS